MSRSIRFREDGVVFRSMGRGTPPRRRQYGASRHFLDDAATPPHGDNTVIGCEEGIRSFQNDTSEPLLVRRGIRSIQDDAVSAALDPPLLTDLTLVPHPV